MDFQNTRRGLLRGAPLWAAAKVLLWGLLLAALIAPATTWAASAGRSRATYVGRLKTYQDFHAYSKEVAGERYTKFVIDIRSGRVYFFDVKVYPVHRDFVFQRIYREKWTRARHREYSKNYGAEKPEFILGYIVHHLVPDIWTVSLWEGDKATPEHVRTIFRRLRRTVGAYASLHFRPDSSAQERMARKLPKKLRVITNDRIYKASNYTAFNTGRAIGTLTLVEPGKAFEDLAFAPDAIVILPDVLSDITPVRGIISERFSTPLAHVNLRAKAWNIPNIGLRQAASRYGHLAGKTVVFEATHRAHALRAATAAEIKAWQQRADNARKIRIPRANLKARELRKLDQLRVEDTSAYGAKSSNLGRLVSAKLKRVHVPDGFGIPIAYYADHMAGAGLSARVRKTLNEPTFKRDPHVRRRSLAALRDAIREAPIDAALLDRVMAHIERLKGTGGVFVRSSTNAEDLPGFNGAGLYNTVPNVVGREAVGAAIRDVWASVWNLVAYEEREHFGIPHERVYGAVLIQRAVNPTAAGVLVTQHPNNPDEKHTYTINAKSGLGLKVVAGKRVPEVVLYDYKNGGLRVLSRSDETTMLVADPKGGVRTVPVLNPGKPVLTDGRARKLGRAARRIEKLFRGVWADSPPLDLEWLYVKRKLNVVQVRPYVVHAPTCPCQLAKAANRSRSPAGQN